MNKVADGCQTRDEALITEWVQLIVDAHTQRDTDLHRESRYVRVSPTTQSITIMGVIRCCVVVIFVEDLYGLFRASFDEVQDLGDKSSLVARA